VLHTYPSEMAQNFWTAIFAWTTCFLVTILVSLFSEPRRDEELKGLVYSLTPIPKDRDLPWYKQPAPLAVVVLVLTVALNVIFW
jgi:solute:Na+ symporter, SSS family